MFQKWRFGIGTLRYTHRFDYLCCITVTLLCYCCTTIAVLLLHCYYPTVATQYTIIRHHQRDCLYSLFLLSHPLLLFYILFFLLPLSHNLLLHYLLPSPFFISDRSHCFAHRSLDYRLERRRMFHLEQR